MKNREAHFLLCSKTLIREWFGRGEFLEIQIELSSPQVCQRCGRCLNQGGKKRGSLQQAYLPHVPLWRQQPMQIWNLFHRGPPSTDSSLQKAVLFKMYFFDTWIWEVVKDSGGFSLLDALDIFHVFLQPNSVDFSSINCVSYNPLPKHVEALYFQHPI